VKSCLDAVHGHGGSRFMTELELERELRDSIGSTLYSSTSEIQRNVIARGLRLWSLPSPSAIDAKTGARWPEWPVSGVAYRSGIPLSVRAAAYIRYNNATLITLSLLNRLEVSQWNQERKL